jgi:DNA-binding XRE family transcriptional regulator
METDAVLADVASRVRCLRAAQALSQRALATERGVSKSFVGAVEAERAGASVRAWLDGLAALGVHLHVQPGDLEAGALADLFRDAAGRRFPAHRTVRQSMSPPTYWWCRHRDRPLSEPLPTTFWGERRRPKPPGGTPGQPPRAASTTSLASACTCARCSALRNDSA